MNITAEFNVNNGKPLVIISHGDDIVGVYRFDIVDINIFELIVKIRPSEGRQFMMVFDGRFKLFVDTLLLTYHDREVRLEPSGVTALEVRGFYDRWYKSRCEE